MVILTGFFIATGRIGANHGDYWDEYYASDLLSRNVRNLSLFPASYYYGGWYTLPARLAIAGETWQVLSRTVAEARTLVGEENM
ncbi:MAG: hypothetical protein KGS60_16065 [Verrucomicrobia bacterium]|nr:hypothetical protein [Verrucomicrobiota bacterium]